MSNTRPDLKDAASKLLLLVVVVIGFVIASDRPLRAQTVTTLYSFTGGADGLAPTGGVILDAQGNLYGTTESSFDLSGHGVVFQLTPTGTEIVLHSFTDSPNDGAYPLAGLVFDTHGNLYGTTTQGGAIGFGTVFEITATGSEKILHSFPFPAPPSALPLANRLFDGSEPQQAGLVVDAYGNLYGTAAGGGWCVLCGTVFEITTTGTETTLYDFKGGTDGDNPIGGLIIDAKGHVYGATVVGGDLSCYNDMGYGCGVVFAVSPSGAETVVYSFAGSPNDGAYPTALLIDAHGNIYGTTCGGGATGEGALFKLTPNGTETLLHSFGVQNGDGTYSCYGGLVMDSQGDLYGTTAEGGTHGYGTLFKSASNGSETVIYSFTGGADGGSPRGGLVLDGKGNIYGTTTIGGIANCGLNHSGGCGTVFKFTL